METILIQNFKAIKNTAKREIKVANLTILMGEQATGKSTVAKLVYFFKKIPEQILFYLDRNTEINEENFEETVSNSINRFFSQLFDSYLLNDFTVSYRYSNDLKVEINNSSKNKDLHIIWSSNTLINSIKEKWLPVHHTSNLLNDDYDVNLYTENERSMIQLARKMGVLFGVNQYSIYVPASRNIVVSMEKYLLDIFSSLEKSLFSNDLNLYSESDYIIRAFIQYIQSIKNKFKRGGFLEIAHSQTNELVTEKLIDELISIVEEVLEGTYRYIDSGERIYIPDSNNYVLLENSSSGQQEAIRIIQDIFLAVLESRPVFRVYEEPESHLSPIGQRGIIHLIAMLANRNPDNQIIIPTHTSYILREVGNMMKASKIVKDNPDVSEEVKKILPHYYWLDTQSVSAYELTREGEINDVKDDEYQMIDGELFDKVTNDISDQFDELLSLQYNLQ